MLSEFEGRIPEIVRDESGDSRNVGYGPDNSRTWFEQIIWWEDMDRAIVESSSAIDSQNGARILRMVLEA